ncbi:MAG: NrfD/PsrC family molybdoenzyme membrane anchor subunit [Gallionellaceae bacterium]
MKTALSFAMDFGSYAIKGGTKYYAWLLFLAFFILVGSYTAYIQLTQGLIVTGATDQVTLEAFFANFVFTAHVAAAAVLVVAPGYLYHRKDMKELAVIGEIVAMVFVATGITFIIFHMGRPDRTWHMIPGIGFLNFPNSMLSFDTIVLNVYLLLNLIGVIYILFKKYVGTFEAKQLARWFTPIVFLAIAWGPLIHIVTAFVLASNARIASWSTAVLPFAFLTMAGASGPALIVMIFLLARKHTKLEISDSVIDLLTTIIAWSLGILMLVFAAEFFTLLYPSTEHADSLKFNMFGHNGLNAYVPWFWGTIVALVGSFIALLFRKVRRSYDLWLPVVNAVIFFAILIEKPMILVFPAFSPTPLGEYAEYHVTLVEFFNVLFVWAVGFMSLTLILKGAIGILTGEVRYDNSSASS